MTSRLQLSGARSMLNRPPVTSTSSAGESGARQQGVLPAYVLITPACNEEVFIKNTLESVVQQTYRPRKWVIVNDGSTDATARIIEPYAAKYDWIELVNLPPRRDRNFSAKVAAFNAGQERVRNLDYEVVGNLYADVSLEKDHFEFLLNKFNVIPA